jgi:hypothetical protein
MESPQRTLLAPAIILAVGIATAGASAGAGFKASRAADRYVTVKGAVEREVEADVAVWPLQLVTAANDLKPEMIAEATSRARESASEFASASGSRVGQIRRANQGIFEILPRDPIPGQGEQNQLSKTVRVVVTIEYLLEG